MSIIKKLEDSIWAVSYTHLIAGRKRPEGQVIYGKEGMVVVASAWITSVSYTHLKACAGFVNSYIFYKQLRIQS